MSNNNGLFSDSVLYYTALYLAAQNGHEEVVKFISELPIPTKGKDMFEFTAFFLAAKNGNLDVLRYFARSDVEFMNELASDSVDDVNVNTCAKAETSPSEKLEANVGGVAVRQKCTNIFETAKKVKLDELRVFINNNIDAFKLECDENGNTLLHLASENGHFGAVKILIQNGAYIRSVNKVGNTPLHLACKSGCFKTVKLLINKKADVNSKNEYGNSPLHFAAESGSESIVKYLVESGAEINIKNKNNETVLFWANNNAVINVLIQNGLNYKYMGKNGNSALHDAADLNKPILVQNLLDRGFEVDSRNLGGGTALMRAALKGNYDVIEVLLRNGANTNERSTHLWPKYTALHFAAKYGHFQVAEKLLQHGAEVDPLDYYNYTPLMDAACEGHIRIVKLLVLHGADKQLRNKADISALGLARDNSHEEIVNVLQ